MVETKKRSQKVIGLFTKGYLFRGSDLVGSKKLQFRYATNELLPSALRSKGFHSLSIPTTLEFASFRKRFLRVSRKKLQERT